MKIFNFFRSGGISYKSKGRLIRNHQVNFKYKGKLLVFDPFTMLEELNFKLKQVKGLDFQLDEISQKILNRHFQKEVVVPNSIAKNKLGREELMVKRTAMSATIPRKSLYEFIWKGECVLSFLRIYDYGKEFEKISEEIRINHADVDLSSYAILFELEKNSNMLLDKFGQTHVWKINDLALFQDLMLGVEEINIDEKQKSSY